MAIAPVNKFISIVVPVAPGQQELYQVPTGTSALVLYVQVANVGVGTYPTVTLTQRRESRSTGLTRDVRVIKDIEIPPNDAAILVDGRMVLEKTPLILDRLLVSGVQSGLATITDVTYCEPLGIATVTTIDNHGFSAGDPITLAGIAFTCSNNNSGITTTIFPDPQSSYVVETVTDPKYFSIRVGSSNGITHFYNGAQHSYVRSDVNSVFANGNAVYFTPTSGSYDSGTGDLELNIPGHGLFASATSHTPNWAFYTPSSGIMTVTTATAHGFSTNNVVKFDDYSLAFKCAMDGSSSIKKYPRSTDPISGKWKKITVGTSTSFTIDVGKSNAVNFTPTAGEYNGAVGIMTLTIGSHSLPGPTTHSPTNAVYNPTTGVMTITLANHNFINGDLIKIDDDAIGFTCTHGAGTKYYPRSTDPISERWIPITYIDANSFSIQVLDSAPSTNTTTHTFVSWTASTLSRATTSVKIATESIKFTCAQDTHASIKSYPRASGCTGPNCVGGADPYYNKPVPIVEAGDTTIALNVGRTTSGGIHTFSSADADAIVSGGDYAHTPVPASFTASGMKRASDYIGIATESVIFTCTQDGNATEHGYPRTGDPAYNTNLNIIEGDVDNIKVNVGISTAGGLVAPLQMEFLASILENSNA